MTKFEENLLLYLETCAVDNGGAVDLRRINDAELAIIKGWVRLGWIGYGRVASEYVTPRRQAWVSFTQLAWSKAALLRQARANRMWDNRKWLTTTEK